MKAKNNLLMTATLDVVIITAARAFATPNGANLPILPRNFV
jgi:hypothetical protein